MEIRLVLRREACQKGTTRFSAMTITRRMNIVQRTRTPTATEHPRARVQTTEVMGIGSQIAVSHFDTENGGNCYDINGRNGVGGRNWSKINSMYTEENPYGANSVDTSANIDDGQYYFGQRIGNATTC